jgi:formate dehydrogenase subunit gamma
MAEPRIQRFNRTQRALHWSHSITFLALLATGIILLVPQIGERIGNHLTVLQIHEYIAIFYITGPLLWLILGDRRSLIKDVQTFDVWDEDDISWLKQSLAAGPAAKDLPPQGRFNAGQKLNGILTIASTVGFIVTGLILWKPIWLTTWAPSWLFTASMSSNAIFLHQILTYVSIPLVLGHIYLAAIARATRPALATIWDGTVPASYARAHHPKWAAEILGPLETQADAQAHGQDTPQVVGIPTPWPHLDR